MFEETYQIITKTLGMYSMRTEICVVIHYLSHGPNSQANIPSHVQSRNAKLVHPRPAGNADQRVCQD